MFEIGDKISIGDGVWTVKSIMYGYGGEMFIEMKGRDGGFVFDLSSIMTEKEPEIKSYDHMLVLNTARDLSKYLQICTISRRKNGEVRDD